MLNTHFSEAHYKFRLLKSPRDTFGNIKDQEQKKLSQWEHCQTEAHEGRDGGDGDTVDDTEDLEQGDVLRMVAPALETS